MKWKKWGQVIFSILYTVTLVYQQNPFLKQRIPSGSLSSETYSLPGTTLLRGVPRLPVSWVPLTDHLKCPNYRAKVKSLPSQTEFSSARGWLQSYFSSGFFWYRIIYVKGSYIYIIITSMRVLYFWNLFLYCYLSYKVICLTTIRFHHSALKVGPNQWQ